ncbi:hypothetical protein MEME101129_21990 [Methylobacterium mesophilicum]
MPRQDKGITAVFARARAGDRRLAPWMNRHHDELVREIGTGRVEWAAALSAFSALGLTDDHGRPLTRDTASRTWRRVREAVAVARQTEARARPAPGELVPGVRLVSPLPVAMPVRTTPAPVAPAAAPIAGTSAGAVEATEHIAAVLAGMSASRVPLPSQPSRHPQPVPMRPVPDKDPTP